MIQPMPISTQQIKDAIAQMTEGVTPREHTLKLIRDFAYSYRVDNDQAYSLN